MENMTLRDLHRLAGRALRSGQSEAEFQANLLDIVAPFGLITEDKELLQHLIRKAYSSARSTQDRLQRERLRPSISFALEIPAEEQKKRQEKRQEKRRVAEMDQLLENHQRLMEHFSL